MKAIIIKGCFYTISGYKMRKTAFIILFSCLFIQATAQEKSKKHELGLSLSSFNSFGVVYRFGTEKNLWRISTVNTFIRRSETKSINSISNRKDTSFGIGIGKEFRTNIDQKNQFRWGIEASYRYRKDHSDFRSLNTGILDRTQTNTTNVIGIQAILGVNFPMGERLLLGVEILPAFTYEYGTEFEERVNPTFVNEFDNSEYRFSLSNNGSVIVFTFSL